MLNVHVILTPGAPSAFKHQTRLDIPHGAAGLYERCERLATEWMLKESRNNTGLHRGAKLWAMLPRLLLIKGERGGPADGRQFKLRCCRFLKGLIEVLWRDTETTTGRHRYDATQTDGARIRRAAKLAEQGLLSKASRTMKQEPMPPLTEDRMNTVRAKYPEAEPPQLDTTRAKELDVQEEVVQKVVAALPKGSSQDCFGRRNEHYKTLYKNGYETTLLSAVECLVV